MEFNEKLQTLRKQKGVTQEELAESLFVSRTAISKWESARGYPNIESLKAIANFFGVTIDELLSGKELLTIAEEDTKQKKNFYRDLVFGLLDICVVMFFFLPFFRQTVNGNIEEASLLSLTEISVCLKIAYFVAVIAIVFMGILTLSLQKIENRFWNKNKSKISLILSVIGTLLLIISFQPYATIFMFMFLVIKALLLIKW